MVSHVSMAPLLRLQNREDAVICYDAIHKLNHIARNNPQSSYDASQHINSPIQIYSNCVMAFTNLFDFCGGG